LTLDIYVSRALATLRPWRGGFLSDARTGKRFPLNLPITFKHKESARKLAATTSNVSAAGVYIQANAKLEVGSKIEFDIVLPAKVVGTDCDVEIVCKGRVVRTENSKRTKTAKTSKTKTDSKRNGIACVIDHYKFVRRP
jgi:hypothetical protein